MKIIKEHIKSGSFKHFYLLYGTEPYLIKLYRDKLKAAVLGNNDQMNFSRFEGKDINQKAIVETAQTLPFFSDRRLILIENSGLFKTQSDLPEQLVTLPESTILLFVEEEIDKRNKLYKLVKEQGVVSEMNGLDEKNLKLFIASLLEQSGKRITSDTAGYLLERTGTDMENIRSETEKLICYAYDRDIITGEDVDAIVTVQITGRIFQMMDAIGSRKQKQAIRMYYDLLSLREKPMSILYLIVRHFNILLQVKELLSVGYHNQAIVETVKIPPFSVSRYTSQSKNYSKVQLIKALEAAADVEEQVKTGRMLEKVGLELLILSLSAEN